MLQLADAKQLKAPSIAHDDLSSPQGAVTGWLLYSTWQLQPCKCCVPCQSDRWTLLPLPPGKVAFRSQYVYMLPGPQWSHADHAIDDKQSARAQDISKEFHGASVEDASPYAVLRPTCCLGLQDTVLALLLAQSAGRTKAGSGVEHKGDV